MHPIHDLTVDQKLQLLLTRCILKHIQATLMNALWIW